MTLTDNSPNCRLRDGFHKRTISMQEASQAPTSEEPIRIDAEDGKSGLLFRVAETLDEVLTAWSSVYEAYRRIEIIDENAHKIHTSIHAASANSAVFIGQLAEQTKTTLTTIHDGEMGLPLDSVFKAELDDLRKSGRRLSEVGLFADRRAQISRSISALFNLMRFAFYYALRDDSATIVIGVHPHHVNFYERLFAFDTLTEIRRYPTVKDNLVVLLQLPLREKMSATRLAKGVA